MLGYFEGSTDAAAAQSIFRAHRSRANSGGGQPSSVDPGLFCGQLLGSLTPPVRSLMRQLSVAIGAAASQ